MSNTTPDQPVTPDESSAVAKPAKAAKAAKAAKRAKPVKKKKKKKTGVPEVKFFITAAALTATIGGWAGLATTLANTPDTPAPVAGQVAPSGQEGLRSVSIPNATTVNGQVLRQATRPKPATRTRSSQ